MTPSSVLKKFNRTIAVWEKGLEQYTLAQLCSKPEPHAWSIGQVYLHLADETIGYNIPQIEICLSGNRNAGKQKSEEGEAFFLRKGFAPVKLKGPASLPNPPQPASIAQVKRELSQIKKQMIRLEKRIAGSTFLGKTKHPGFYYLNAGEWYQFIEMHFRHHLRQKKRIDAWLNLQQRRSTTYS